MYIYVVYIMCTVSHKLALTLDSLLELYNHTLTVRLWNTVDKVSARVRYDRPKAFRLPVSAEKSESTTTHLSHLPGVYHGLSSTSIKQARRKSVRPSGCMENHGDDSFECLVSPQKSQKVLDHEQGNTFAKELTLIDSSLSPGLKG